MQYKYCIDASSLISAWRFFYPPEIFKTLWGNIAELIKEGRLISPYEVYVELERKEDELLDWIKRFKDIMFIELNENEQILVSEVMEKFPKLIDINKSSTQADPFVVSLAYHHNAIVITEEKPDKAKKKKTKIPTVCLYYRIKFMTFLELIKAEGWNY